MVVITPPAHPLNRFLEIHRVLEQERRWYQGATALRFAALSALCCPGEPEEVAAGIRRTAEELENASSWLGPFRSDLRFIVGAMLQLHGADPVALVAEIRRVQKVFRDYGLRRGGTYEALAILLLWLGRDGEPVSDPDVGRFQEIYEQMKRYHWWLTGPDDFPACAVLVAQDGEPEAIGQKIEAVYKALQGVGFRTGDPLQTAANILSLAGGPAEEAAHRYKALAEALEGQGVKIRTSAYDELALLAFLGHEPAEVARRLAHHQDVIADVKPTPGRELAFSIASTVTFLDLVQKDRDLQQITDAKALMDMQSILSAQAAAAAVAASTAAVTAAATSGN